MDVERLKKISVENLKIICRRHMKLTRLDSRTRTGLYSAISGQHATVQESINAEASRAIESGLTKYGQESRKEEGSQGPSKRRRANQEMAENIDLDMNGENCAICNKERLTDCIHIR